MDLDEYMLMNVILLQITLGYFRSEIASTHRDLSNGAKFR
jgi:hypothetical protein